MLWERLTGKPVEILSFGSDLDGFSLYYANKEINAAIKTGDEAIVTLLIRSQMPIYARAATFTLSEYRSGSERISTMLEAMSELDALFADSAIGRLHDQYGLCAGSIAFYRNLDRAALSTETLEFVATQAGSVGLDALHSIDRLTRLMIKDGIPAPAAEAKLGRNIYDISRIEDLLMHAHQIPTGFSCVSSEARASPVATLSW